MASLHGKSLPGQEDTLTVTWVPNGAPSIVPPGKDEQRDEAMDAEPSNAGDLVETRHEEKEDKEEGEVQQGEMDYEVADENEWIE